MFDHHLKKSTISPLDPFDAHVYKEVFALNFSAAET